MRVGCVTTGLVGRGASAGAAAERDPDVLPARTGPGRRSASRPRRRSDDWFIFRRGRELGSTASVTSNTADSTAGFFSTRSSMRRTPASALPMRRPARRAVLGDVGGDDRHLAALDRHRLAERAHRLGHGLRLEGAGVPRRLRLRRGGARGAAEHAGAGEQRGDLRRTRQRGAPRGLGRLHSAFPSGLTIGPEPPKTSRLPSNSIGFLAGSKRGSLVGSFMR